MNIWKKNLVAAAILVTVCSGIYINWLYMEDQATMVLTDTLDADKILSSDTLVISQEGNVSLNNSENTVEDYFAAVRLSRQQARDAALNIIQEAMAYDETSRSTTQLEEIVQTALTEAQIESLIIAKGYIDCVAYISSEGISVAVASPEGGMDNEDVAVIADIIMSQSDFELKDIRVIPVQ